MIIELKNIPVYDKGLKIDLVTWSTIDTFESMDMKLNVSSDTDSTDEYWVVLIETKNSKAAYRAPTREKQEMFYRVVKDALLNKLEFLSIDFEDWRQ